MSEQTDLTEPTAFVRYWRRSTPEGQDYDKHEASVSVPVPIPADGPQSQTFLATVDGILADLKALTWDALGIVATVNADGKLVEVIPEPKPQAAAPPAGGGGGRQAPAPAAAPRGGGKPDLTCGICTGRTFNNTAPGAKRNPKGPDYKCSNRDECGAAMWLEKDGSEGDWKL